MLYFLPHQTTRWLLLLAFCELALLAGALYLATNLRYFRSPPERVLTLGLIAVAAFRWLLMRLMELDALKRRRLISGAGVRPGQGES
ncbi:hypothetical protein [Dyella subtropica]|uniref:hypothetical protein n=1 Tax=Dyella subtropica TaxID=2992127 RepID=UPI0022556716|nr:hypothetical protein [Dyella subtropica]